MPQQYVGTSSGLGASANELGSQPTASGSSSSIAGSIALRLSDSSAD